MHVRLWHIAPMWAVAGSVVPVARAYIDLRASWIPTANLEFVNQQMESPLRVAITFSFRVFRASHPRERWPAPT